MTKEMWEKAKAAKSAEELMTLAKEYSIELTAEQAKDVFDKLRTGELPDDDLDGAAGGAFGFSFLQSLLKHQEMERKAAEQLARIQCPYCGKVGAWRSQDGAVFCNSCHAVL